jgi:serine phosphatase RsbU (regulator of sigma subunit)
MLFDALLHKLEGDLRASCEVALASARTQLEGGLAKLAKERAKGFDEVNEERIKGLAEVAKEKAALHREIAAMQKQQEAQQGRIVLDVGGYRYTTSVQTLRRLPGTFFDAYFSGRYTMETGTASTSGRCWSTCGTAWCWRRRSTRRSLMSVSYDG